MSQQQPSKNASGASRQGDTSNRRPSDMITDYAGVDEDGFEYPTAVQGMQRPGWAPMQQDIDDVVSSGCPILTNIR